MKYVYVISKSGESLMPTCRYGHVRRLLKEKKARVVRREPFTIQLLYETTEYTQPLVMGIDPGACTIGMAVRRENGEIVFAGELTLRSRQVTEKMAERRMHRRSRRNYRRLRRIRRARKAKTRFKAKQYRIVGIKEPLVCKEIRPKLSRFHNRKRKAGWLTATARHLLESHKNFVKKITQMVPITEVVIEYAQFDVQKLANPDVQGKQYQEGKQKGYANCREYVLQRDQYTCQLCKKTQRELHAHHVIWQSKGGGDAVEKPASTAKQELQGCVVYKFAQFRRHNRQLIHAKRDRNYYEGKRGAQVKLGKEEPKPKSKIVAKNRHKRMGQTSDSLAEYLANKGKEHLGTLQVTKGQKMIRSKKEKYRAGDVVLRQNKTKGIVTGTGHKGYSVMLRDEKNYVVARKCEPLLKNTGIVCVGHAQSEKIT